MKNAVIVKITGLTKKLSTAHVIKKFNTADIKN